jgi:hypothetical protein
MREQVPQRHSHADDALVRRRSGAPDRRPGCADAFGGRGRPRARRKDPGRPEVPTYGREIHYANLRDVIPLPPLAGPAEEQSKYEVLGAHWPSRRDHGTMRRAARAFADTLSMRSASRPWCSTTTGPCAARRARTDRLRPASWSILCGCARAGIVVGIASGRGGSIQSCLQEVLPPDVLPKIRLACTTAAGSQGRCAAESAGQTSEFLSHVTRIVVRLKSLGVPILAHRTTPPYQVSVRFREGLATDGMWFVIADALAPGWPRPVDHGSQQALGRHPREGREQVGARLRTSSRTTRLIPYEILTMGDQGAWPGNDAALLEHRYSLSVDMPSRRLDRAWKLAPAEKRDVDATLWYLERMVLEGGGAFRLDPAGCARRRGDQQCVTRTPPNCWPR